MSKLNGKAAIITGASRGIGQAVALRLASEGAAIYMAADGTEAELEETEKACRDAGAPDAAWGCMTYRTQGRRRPWWPPPGSAWAGWTFW